MKIIVLGAGLVGRPMAIDLARDKNLQVTVADLNKKNLDLFPEEFQIKKIQKDFSNPAEVIKLVKGYDLVLSAVPGFMGFKTLEAIISAGKNVVDIAFFPEDPFQLDDLAKKKNVTAIIDCGVAPGMSNILIGHIDNILDKTKSVLIYVGGLPEIRNLPYEYKAVFSPIDVIEEYTRPARYIENGNLVTRPALSDPEFINFPGLGTLEAFNSDGLRTLATTLKAPNMKEKTLRYPGHIEKILLLRETGFFSNQEIEVQGIKIKPIDFTAKLLFPLWELKTGETDFTVMKVVVEGERNNKELRYVYDLLDRFDEKTNVHSMARTTGYTATMVVRTLAEKLFDRKGICPPEYIGKQSGCLDFILKGLKERNITYHETIETIK